MSPDFQAALLILHGAQVCLLIVGLLAGSKRIERVEERTDNVEVRVGEVERKIAARGPFVPLG